METRTDIAGLRPSIGNSTSARAGVKRHPDLYLEHEKGTVIILVEETLFKIHEYFLKRHSIVFASMFTLNPGHFPAEGTSDDLPILLPDVREVDFARFLYLFYPRNIVQGDITTLEEWTSVLQIAHRYEFEEHRKLAVGRLEGIATPIDRILLSRAYDIPEWLETAYYELCVREESLSLGEGTRLGMADVILISDLRQRIRGSPTPFRMPEQHIRWTIRSKLHALSPS
ncbi:hypothetical protein BD414DRAFT_484523 [Trametes punicea]|nr:hypothetical protein BD414DRAFT_484523 [Trametes punicea]